MGNELNNSLREVIAATLQTAEVPTVESQIAGSQSAGSRADGVQITVLPITAIQTGARSLETPAAVRPVTPLRAVETEPATPPATVKGATVTRLGAFPPSVTANAPGPISIDEAAASGPSSLRLAFWLCGFHDALMQRQRQGEQLTDVEMALVKLSGKDFAGLRAHVISLTVNRLNALVNAPELDVDSAVSGTMEAFAVATLRSLSQKACQLLRDEGPDAALSLFGDSGSIREPLAIFQVVFTTALDLVETFERMIPQQAVLLARLAEALDSEVENI